MPGEVGRAAGFGLMRPPIGRMCESRNAGLGVGHQRHLAEWPSISLLVSSYSHRHATKNTVALSMRRASPVVPGGCFCEEQPGRVLHLVEKSQPFARAYAGIVGPPKGRARSARAEQHIVVGLLGLRAA